MVFYNSERSKTTDHQVDQTSKKGSSLHDLVFLFTFILKVNHNLIICQLKLFFIVLLFDKSRRFYIKDVHIAYGRSVRI